MGTSGQPYGGVSHWKLVDHLRRLYLDQELPKTDAEK